MRGRRAGRQSEQPSTDEELSLYELAWLAGGGWRVAETALLRMILANRLEMDRNGMLRVIRPRPRDEVEAVLLAAIGPSGTAWIGAPRAAFGSSAPADGLEAGLRRRGLLVGGLGSSQARRPRQVPAGWVVPVTVAVVLTAVAALAARAAVVVLGVEQGAAVVLGGLAALVVAAPPARRLRRWQEGKGNEESEESGEGEEYQRPADRACPLLAALEAGAAVPPGWRLAEDVLAPVGRTSWSAVAVVGVEALGRDRLTVAVRGSQALPGRRRPRTTRAEDADAAGTRRQGPAVT